MRFIDENGGIQGLMDAARMGYPATAGYFSPTGDADLRPAVYAPEASFSDTAASSIASLFPEDIDPLMAERLASRAFSQAPSCVERGEGIVVADYTSGPSACAADQEAAFLVGILASVTRHSGPRILLADGSGSEGGALAEAVAGARDLRLALLYPEGRLAGGIKGHRLAREGGQVTLLAVRGDRSAVDALIRDASGRSFAGAEATAAGPANPARFAARIVSLAATFAIMRRGSAGDLFMGISGGDGLGLAACLWAWRLGLPLNGIVLSVSERGVLGPERSGRHLVGLFDAERPGAIRSLTYLHNVDRPTAEAARAAFATDGGRVLDFAAAASLAAAEHALAAGLRGHARIVVPMRGDAWDEVGEASSPRTGLRDARVDAEIAPTLAELERALTV